MLKDYTYAAIRLVNCTVFMLGSSGNMLTFCRSQLTTHIHSIFSRLFLKKSKVLEIDGLDIVPLFCHSCFVATILSPHQFTDIARFVMTTPSARRHWN